MYTPSKLVMYAEEIKSIIRTGLVLVLLSTVDRDIPIWTSIPRYMTYCISLLKTMPNRIAQRSKQAKEEAEWRVLMKELKEEVKVIPYSYLRDDSGVD